MKNFRNLAKNSIFWLIILSIAYFVIRITNLTALPIFTDEAIYIRWSQIGAQDAAWRFISLTDGKQPLYTWFAMAAVRIFHDPLFAGRFVSIMSGFMGMLGMYMLGYELFRKKSVGILASFLYLVSPFTLMYDRLALYDSLVAAFSIWNFYLAILLVRTIRLDVALIFGLTLGVGMLNKTSAFLSLYLVPVTLLLFDWKKTTRNGRLVCWVGLVILAAVLSQIVYSILRLSPFFYIIAQKNALFVYPLKEWLKHPFDSLYWNLHGLFDWLIHYLTLPIFVACLAPFILNSKKTLEKILLISWWIIPFTGLALFGRVLYPRFILFMAMPLLVMSAYTIDWIIQSIRNRIWRLGLIVLICVQCVYISQGVVFDIVHSKIPKSEMGQYINDWPSGWGTNQIVLYLNRESQKEHLAVYTEGTFGLFPFALEIYLNKNTNIEIHGVWPPSRTIPDDIALSASKKSTYYITNLTQTKPDWPLELIDSFQKGNNPNSFMRLYKIVLPKK
jgi:4-amino-4-deoxy-L-arabinose transferase-like glycosyltransferase